MTRFVLEGGSRKGEVALFSRDDLPELPGSGLDERDIVRVETRGDSLYLLHLYVDETPPDAVKSWLDADDTLSCDFTAETGAIAFGGAESMHGGFQPNPAVRSDAEIPPGTYRAVVYHADYPDERLEEAVAARLGAPGVDKVKRPGRIIGGAVLLIIAMIIMGFADTPWYFGGALLVAAIAWGWTRLIKKAPEYRALAAAKLEVERAFPSLVITLESIKT